VLFPLSQEVVILLGAHGLEFVAFFAFVAFATWLDLFVLHKDDHDIGFKEAAWYSVGWISIALAFSGYVYFQYGPVLWMEYLAGYTLEKALSIDNIFVIAMIFGFFGIKGGLQHRALAWGIIGAIIMRAILILLGVELVHRFTWLLPLFGLFLLVTAYKMLTSDGHTGGLQESRFYQWATKRLPVYQGFDGNKILTRQNGRLMLTTLGLTIVMVEATDLVFAVDSIPAVMGVSQDPFIILTSNVFAILGLRALYFLLASVIHKFRYLSIGLSAALGFIGFKMLLLPFGYHVPIGVSLSVVIGVIAVSIGASLLIPEKAPDQHS
jgi:tellurite resistance protein TerC